MRVNARHAAGLKINATAPPNQTGNERIGVRLAPLTTLQGAIDDTPEATYVAAAYHGRKKRPRCSYR